MKALMIILIAYVALDIITGTAIYIVLRKKGWSRYNLAWKFRDALRLTYDEFIERHGWRY